MIPASPKAPGARRSLLLIGGMPRSGTTLLSNLIQRELHIPIAPETHFFDIAVRTGTAGLPPELQADPRLMAAYEGLAPERSADQMATFRTLLERLLPGPAEVIGEKTPDHLMQFERILRLDPDVKAVVITRACAEVCASLARMSWNVHGFEQNLARWQMYYRQGARLAALFPARVAMVSYERLCAGPEAVLATLARRIGLVANAGPVPDSANYDVRLEPWKEGADGPVRRTGSGRGGAEGLAPAQRRRARRVDRATRLRAWLRTARPVVRLRPL